jgi:hypothetical protein
MARQNASRHGEARRGWYTKDADRIQTELIP